jgi:hypothetical protein
MSSTTKTETPKTGKAPRKNITLTQQRVVIMLPNGRKIPLVLPVRSNYIIKPDFKILLHLENKCYFENPNKTGDTWTANATRNAIYKRVNDENKTVKNKLPWDAFFKLALKNDQKLDARQKQVKAHLEVRLGVRGGDKFKNAETLSPSDRAALQFSTATKQLTVNFICKVLDFTYFLEIKCFSNVITNQAKTLKDKEKKCLPPPVPKKDLPPVPLFSSAVTEATAATGEGVEGGSV